MITHGASIKNGAVLTAKVCIVGSGPAGVTAAWVLQKAGVDVILLEGARNVGTGPNYVQLTWADKEKLYNGEAVGQFANNEPQFLVRPTMTYPAPPSERERAFGGTSTHWGGQSRPIDAVAFAGRGADYPAWPVTRQEMDPWYQLAAVFCNLYSDNFDADFWAKTLDAQVPVLPGFEPAMYQFIGPNFLNYATRKFSDGTTIGSSKCNVILNATLLDIVHAGGNVKQLTVGSMTQDPDHPARNTVFTVKADRYVLALGAVANARQLLLAKVPNDHIGRYFMCHPLVQSWIPPNPPDPIRITGNFLNGAQTNWMAGNQGKSKWKDKKTGVYVEGRLCTSAAQQKALGIGSCWIWGNGDQGLYFEQAPNPLSRVTLAASKDGIFGQPQTRIDWRFSSADSRTYNETIRLLAKGVKALVPGATVTATPWSEVRNQAVVNGHHLGTTRMSNTAADGVVDRNLRSHDLRNLYVAGSSVWRTACIPNPTFSIITFSLRLADQLIRDLGKT